MFCASLGHSAGEFDISVPVRDNNCIALFEADERSNDTHDVLYKSDIQMTNWNWKSRKHSKQKLKKYKQYFKSPVEIYMCKVISFVGLEKKVHFLCASSRLPVIVLSVLNGAIRSARKNYFDL